MIQIHNNSDTVFIVVHEIYGINAHITGVCDWLAKTKADVLCPNLLGNRQKPFHYTEELDAYQHFMQNVGFASAQEQIETLVRSVRDQYRYCFVIGYSIGATIAWLCSRHAELCSGVVGIYGSRIRDYTAQEAQCPVLLCFPRMEESFDVAALVQALAGKTNVNLIKADALHGFADPLSEKYCAAENETLWRKIFTFIEAQKENTPMKLIQAIESR
ncbi:MAG: DeoR family transcriptional regulator [Firmicutes bacterium]|nr:DeoR family transcriptional regulator [Bacillota bacterium]